MIIYNTILIESIYAKPVSFKNEKNTEKCTKKKTNRWIMLILHQCFDSKYWLKVIIFIIQNRSEQHAFSFHSNKKRLQVYYKRFYQSLLNWCYAIIYTLQRRRKIMVSFSYISYNIDKYFLFYKIDMNQFILNTYCNRCCLIVQVYILNTIIRHDFFMVFLCIFYLKYKM